MEFKSKDELFSFLADLQGQIANLQEQMDKANPVTDPEPEPTNPDEPIDPTPEEIDEIDSLLQGE